MKQSLGRAKRSALAVRPGDLVERGVAVLKRKSKPKGKVRLTCDVERGAQKGIDWITFFSGHANEVYDIMYTDPRGVWMRGKSSQVPVLLRPDEYELVDDGGTPSRPQLRLI